MTSFPNNLVPELTSQVATSTVNTLVPPFWSLVWEHVSYAVKAEEKVEDLEKNMEELKRRFTDIHRRRDEALRDPTQRPAMEVEGWLNKVTETGTKVSAIKTNFEQRCNCFGCCGNIFSSYSIGKNASETLAEVKDLYVKLGGAMGGPTLVLQVFTVGNVEEKLKDLEDKMKDLKRRASDFRSRVEAAERDPTQRRTGEVEGLLDKVRDMDTYQVSALSTIRAKFDLINAKSEQSSDDIRNCNEIHKEATKKLAAVDELYEKLGETMRGSLTVPVPLPPGQELPSPSNSLAIESNHSKVLGYLADGVAVVEIYGMGGVGKTTLLKKINNDFIHGNARSDTAGGREVHFQHVIWAVVSRGNADWKKELQRAIAAEFKVELKDNEEASWPRKITNFLKNKKFVLLLDDLWERVDLDAIGIPTQGRTVVFTTRLVDVCGRMDAKKRVKVECLSEEDAWQLFMEKVGDDAIKGNPTIERLAREVTKQCHGLPLALITIGRAMSSKETANEWEHALTSLKKSNWTSAVPDAEEELLCLLSYSYDRLVDNTTRECFLCCALFPEDYEIRKDELIECFLGHGLLDSRDFLDDIGETYNYGHNLIGNLKSACLLESSDEGKSVKMHDIVRDMAGDRGMNSNKWIVRKEQLKGANNWELANRISIMNGMRTFLEPKVMCPSLSTLMVKKNKWLKMIPPNVFQYFPALTYLDISSTWISDLPQDVTLLVQLQYLNLSETSVKSLSKTLSKLEKLKYLILRSCHSLSYVEQGVISSFTALQVLDLSGSYSVAFTSELSRCSSSKINVAELKSLRGRIKALGLRMELHELSVLHEYVDLDTICKLDIEGLPNSKSKVDKLVVGKNIQNLFLDNFVSLEELTLTRSDDDWHFQWLHRFALFRLSELRMIVWKPEISQATFPQLRTLQIGECHKLKNLTWIRHVPCLTHLDVDECNELTDIIPDEGQTPSIFPNLQSIILRELPALSNIYSGTIDCPSLDYIDILECKSLERLPFSFQSHIANKKPLVINIEQKVRQNLKWPNDDIKSYIEQLQVRKSDSVIPY